MTSVAFGNFDHIEHMAGVPLDRPHLDRLTRMGALDRVASPAATLPGTPRLPFTAWHGPKNIFLAAGASGPGRSRSTDFPQAQAWASAKPRMRARQASSAGTEPCSPPGSSMSSALPFLAT